MHCHLRGNFSCLGEERATKKSTEPLASAMARLLGIARNNPQTARVQQDALLASFLLASPPPKTLRGVKLAYSTLHTISPRATLSPGGTMRRTVSTPLQAKGHRRSRTPRAQCSSANPTEAKGWCARPLQLSPTARKHSSSIKA